MIREKALHLTREDIPHALTVEVDAIEETAVRAHLYVETESQKGIVVGKQRGWCARSGPARPEVEALSATPSSSISWSRCGRKAPRPAHARAAGPCSRRAVGKPQGDASRHGAAAR